MSKRVFLKNLQDTLEKYPGRSITQVANLSGYTRPRVSVALNTHPDLFESVEGKAERSDGYYRTVPVWFNRVTLGHPDEGTRREWKKFRVVGFAGPAGSGKDTAGTALRQALLQMGVVARCDAMAAPIKAMLAAAGFPEPATHAGKERIIPDLGVSWRFLAQKLGTEWRLMVHPELWLMMLERRAREFQGLTIITDIRFPQEASWVRAHGWLVHVDGPTTTTSKHVSEVPLARKPDDFTVDNFGRGDEMAGLVRQMLTIATLVKSEL